MRSQFIHSTSDVFQSSDRMSRIEELIVVDKVRNASVWLMPEGGLQTIRPNRLSRRGFGHSVLWSVPQDVPQKALNEASLGDGWSLWVWGRHRTQHLLTTAFLVWTCVVLSRHGVPHGVVDAPWPSAWSLGRRLLSLFPSSRHCCRGEHGTRARRTCPSRVIIKYGLLLTTRLGSTAQGGVGRNQTGGQD